MSRTRTLTAALAAGLMVLTAAPAGAATQALPKNGDVVFVSNGSYLAVQAGSTGVRTMLGEGAVPKYSPDGRQLAFTRSPLAGEPLGFSTIVIRTLATGMDRDVYQFAGGGDTKALTWSPDATSLALSDGERLDRISVATGARSTIYTAPTGTVLQAPAWSPDGSRIAFSTGNAIKLVHPDGTNLRTLTSSATGVLNNYPDWSPDSQKIAFVTNRYKGTYHSELVTLPRSGAGEPFRVSHLAYPDGIFYNGVAWSPDGKKIAAMQFNRNVLPDEQDTDERFRVRAYLPDGSYSYTLVSAIVGDDGPLGLDWAPKVS